MRGHYYLDERNNAVRTDDITEALRKTPVGERGVSVTRLWEARISTMFLGINRNWGDGPPLLFSTIVLGGQYDEEEWLCTTWKEAEEQHARVVEMVKASMRSSWRRRIDRVLEALCWRGGRSR